MLNTVYILERDHRLWLVGRPFGAIPPQRELVDQNVEFFQAWGDQEALILGTDGKLWLASGPWGQSPPARVQIDSSVLSFAARSLETIFILGRDRKLWIAFPPFGSLLPPSRVLVDQNVSRFEPLPDSTVLVEGTDHNLWHERPPFGMIPPNRDHVDATLHEPLGEPSLYFWSSSHCFRAVFPRITVSPPLQNVYVHGYWGNLWLERAPFGSVPPARDLVDANVFGFAPLDDRTALIIGNDRKLWLANAPFGSAPPSQRELIAENISDCQWLDTMNPNPGAILARDGDGVLWRHDLVAHTREFVASNVFWYEPAR